MADGLLLFISGLFLFLSPGAYGQITKTINVSSDDNSDGTITLLLPERVSLTQPLNVSVGIGSYTFDFLIGETIYLNVSTSDVRITASYDEHSFVVDNERIKTISVKFNLSPDVPLLEKQVKVNVSVSFNKKQSTSAIVQLIDGRAGIGFHPSFQKRLPCYPNSSCDLALTIKMSTISTFDVTLTLLNSTNHKVNKVSFQVNRENTDYHIQVTAPTAGVFTAMLTVADDMTNLVYWIQQNLTVTVEENQLKLELDSLTQQFKQLSAKYDMLMSNYTTLSTKLENIFDRFGDGFGEYLCANVECGEHGDCGSGKCICTSDVISGANCDEFVGCEGKPCGNRGNCSQPANIDDKFECKCHDENVTGKNCSVCNGTVSCNGRGNCSVNVDNGRPSCNCSAHYGGDYCNVCAAGWTGNNCELKLCTEKELECGDHGDCYYVNGTNVTQCYYDGSIMTTTPSMNITSSPPTVNITPTTPPKATTPTDPPAVPSEDQDDGNSNLLYGGLIIFIAVLVVCVVAYLAYHNKDKIIDLLGWKKESVVEMAMRSRTKKSKGYQKLPTSIHDTVTHED